MSDLTPLLTLFLSDGKNKQTNKKQNNWENISPKS